MEQMRRRPHAGSGDDSIGNQFAFVKICCDVGQLDLTDFFEKWGFFWAGTLTVDDYHKYRFEITPEMVEATKASIARKHYPKPAEDLTLVED
jgi:hypothetical protein